MQSLLFLMHDINILTKTTQKNYTIACGSVHIVGIVYTRLVSVRIYVRCLPFMAEDTAIPIRLFLII